MKPEYLIEQQWNVLNEMEIIGVEQVCRVLQVPPDQLVTQGSRNTEAFGMNQFYHVVLRWYCLVNGEINQYSTSMGTLVS